MVTVVFTKKDEDGEAQKLVVPEANAVNLTPNGDLVLVGPIMGGQPGQGRVLRTIAAGYWETSVVEESMVASAKDMGGPILGGRT